MEMKRIAIVCMAGLITAGLFAGCETSPPSVSETALLAEYGGYTTQNEAPGFGDPVLIAAHREDAAYNDPMERDPEVSAAEKDRGARKYMLRMVWGNLDSPDTSETSGGCPPTDWSGSIKAEGGVLIIARTIRFEPDDSIVRPRHGAREIEWISHTRNNVDGLVLKIVDVPDPRHRQVRNSITITTPFYTAEIPFADLADLDRTAAFDTCNGISLVATEIERSGCPRGFLEGTWVSETDTSGNFEGAWIADDGALTGFLHGHYGVADSSRVLVGKWITTSGEFGGLLKGTWNPSILDEAGDEDVPGGNFEGKWVNDAFTEAGRFNGHYGFPDSTSNGVFRGRWKDDCR
jgi:hypothetical protein